LQHIQACAFSRQAIREFLNEDLLTNYCGSHSEHRPNILLPTKWQCALAHQLLILQLHQFWQLANRLECALKMLHEHLFDSSVDDGSLRLGWHAKGQAVSRANLTQTPQQSPDSPLLQTGS
jgi:hypothetical protein